MINSRRLLLGVDGGGSKTAALVASLDETGQLLVIGRGRGGPSNLRLAGKEQSLASLDQAVDEALFEAKVQDQKVDYAVLALAGVTAPDVQADVSNWAKERKLALHAEIIPDIDPVLANGVADGWGIALIVGTGSVAVGIVTMVDEPVMGCLTIASKKLTGPGRCKNKDAG